MEQDETFLSALGRVTLEFSQLEWFLKASIAILLEKDMEVCHAATAQASFQQLLNIFASLFRLGVDEPKLIEKLGEVLKEIVEAAQKRNRIIHSTWFGVADNDELGHFIRVTAKRSRGLSHEERETEPGELTEIADSIKTSAGSLSVLVLASRQYLKSDRA